MYLLGLFSLNPADLTIILFLALLFFGAKRLPELARSLGSAITEFNKAKEDVHRQITQVVEPPQPAPLPAASPAVAAAPVVADGSAPAPAAAAPVAPQPAPPSDSQPQA